MISNLDSIFPKKPILFQQFIPKFLSKSIKILVILCLTMRLVLLCYNMNKQIYLTALFIQPTTIPIKGIAFKN